MTTISVCIGSACHKRGSYAILQRLKELAAQENVTEKVSILPVFCLGECKNGVSVKVDEKLFLGVTVETAETLFRTSILPKIG